MYDYGPGFLADILWNTVSDYKSRTTKARFLHLFTTPHKSFDSRILSTVSWQCPFTIFIRLVFVEETKLKSEIGQIERETFRESFFCPFPGRSPRSFALPPPRKHNVMIYYVFVYVARIMR